MLQAADLALGALAGAVGGDDDGPGLQRRAGGNSRRRRAAAWATQAAWKPASPAEGEVDLGGRGVAPGVGGVAGDGLDVGAGLGGERRPCRDEAGGAGLAAVVGDRGEADVAEVAAEVGEVAGGRDERLGRVEGIGEAAQRGGAGHELGDALGAGRAEGGGVEQAFLPDQPGEEAGSSALARGRRLDEAADVGGVAGEADAGGAVGGAVLGGGRARGGGARARRAGSVGGLGAQGRREAEKPRDQRNARMSRPPVMRRETSAGRAWCQRVG